MKIKYLILTALAFFHFLSHGQVNTNGSPIPISVDTEALQITLLQGDSEQRLLTINNDALERMTLGLSLSNTSHQTASGLQFLTTPLLFKLRSRSIYAYNAQTAERILEKRIIRIPEDTFNEDGLAYDGKYVYYTSNTQSGIVYKMDPDSNSLVDSKFVNEFQNTTIDGLAHSGEYLYAANTDDDIIYKLEFETGSIVEQFAVEGLGQGLTFGGNRGTLFSTTETMEIIEINIVTHQIISRFPLPLTSGGLAYSKELGILISDKSFYEIQGIDPDTGEFLPDMLEAAGNSAAANETFGLEWLDFESVTIDIEAGSSSTYELNFNTAGLESGHYETTIHFALNDGSNTNLDIPVSLTILPIINDIVSEFDCSPYSDNRNLWRIQSPNEVPVKAYWEVLNSDLADSIDLAPGENLLFTEITSEDGDTIQFGWINEEGVVKTITAISGDEVCNTRALILHPHCSGNPNIQRSWRVANSNLFPVNAIWELEGTDIEGVIKAIPGNSFFSTPTTTEDEVQTVKITWIDDEGNPRRQRKISGIMPCELRGLTLNPVCTDDPDGRKRWEVVNPNSFNVSVDWALNKTNLRGNINANPGSTFFYTIDTDTAQQVKIIWLDRDRNPRRQQKFSNLGACETSDSPMARKAVINFDKKSDNEDSIIKVFPNPFHERLMIKMKGADKEVNAYAVRLTNMLGSEVYTNRISDGDAEVGFEIETSGLAQGSYILTITSSNNIYRSTVVKR